MKTMVLEEIGRPLSLREKAVPKPEPHQLLIKVKACAVCRTDLHIIDGDLPPCRPSITPGHEIIGEVVGLGDNARGFRLGDRVGVPWLGFTCGVCFYCRHDQENLCDRAKFTGYQLDGGFAEYLVADARYSFPIPGEYSDMEAAPLMCAGLIGYRALKMAGNAERLGIYGFGAAAHIVTQVAVYQRRSVFAFTRAGDEMAQEFALSLGCIWAGGSDEAPGTELDAALIFAPVGSLIPAALKAVRKGGIVICAGIHMSDIPSFSYDLLWGERVVRSVANLTRADAVEFLELAPQIPVKTTIQAYRLEDANAALSALREGRLVGAAVLRPDDGGSA